MNRFLRLVQYLFPYKWYAVQNIIYNILGSFFGLFTFTMVIPFLQILFDKQQMVTDPLPFELSVSYAQHMLYYAMSKLVVAYGKPAALILVSVLVVVLSLLKNGFVFLANHVLSPIRAYTVRDIRNQIYRKVLRLPLSYYTEARKGDVIARISSDVQEIETSIMSSLQIVFRDPITILIFMGYLLSRSGKLTLFVLILLPISGLLIGRIGRSLRKTSFEGQQLLGVLLSLLEETLSGLRIIKAFNGETRMENRFSQTNNHFSHILKKTMRRRYLASPVSEFLGTIVLMVLMSYGGYMVLGQSAVLSSESLIAYLIIFSQVITPAKNFSSAYFNILKGMASMDRIDELLDADEQMKESENALDIHDFRESIEFRNVSFRYDKEMVLRNINLTIRKGQTIALVGKSGSGKSTLADLLPRFMDVTEGEILIDGQPVTGYKVKQLRKLMGIVSQQSILFNDTIYNNIAFGADDADEEKVRYAAGVANALSFIDEYPDGLYTNIGEGGSKLSGGQRQRLSIARAVMANPPVLILDEATSALDTESEKLVQDAILRLMENRTSLVIAHRLSTIKHADLIVVIDDGKIVEAGVHDELINRKSGLYRKLHKLQMY
ncbi:MAG: ABC transporter ATP-binding protein [Bacteroidota bacterium]